MKVNNPISYYRTVPFWSIDSIVYTASLIGIVGGLLGNVQAFRLDYEWKEFLPYVVLLGASAWASIEGLKIAGLHYGPGGASDPNAMA